MEESTERVSLDGVDPCIGRLSTEEAEEPHPLQSPLDSEGDLASVGWGYQGKRNILVIVHRGPRFECLLDDLVKAWTIARRGSWRRGASVYRRYRGRTPGGGR